MSRLLYIGEHIPKGYEEKIFKFLDENISLTDISAPIYVGTPPDGGEVYYVLLNEDFSYLYKKISNITLTTFGKICASYASMVESGFLDRFVHKTETLYQFTSCRVSINGEVHSTKDTLGVNRFVRMIHSIYYHMSHGGQFMDDARELVWEFSEICDRLKALYPGNELAHYIFIDMVREVFHKSDSEHCVHDDVSYGKCQDIYIRTYSSIHVNEKYGLSEGLKGDPLLEELCNRVKHHKHVPHRKYKNTYYYKQAIHNIHQGYLGCVVFDNAKSCTNIHLHTLSILSGEKELISDKELRGLLVEARCVKYKALDLIRICREDPVTSYILKSFTTLMRYPLELYRGRFMVVYSYKS